MESWYEIDILKAASKQCISSSCRYIKVCSHFVLGMMLVGVLEMNSDATLD